MLENPHISDILLDFLRVRHINLISQKRFPDFTQAIRPLLPIQWEPAFQVKTEEAFCLGKAIVRRIPLPHLLENVVEAFICKRPEIRMKYDPLPDGLCRIAHTNFEIVHT